MRLVELVIAFSDVLLCAGIRGIAESDQAARVISRREPFDQIQSYRIESRWIDLVIDETLGCCKRDWTAIVTRRRGDSREIAPQHGGCRNIVLDIRRILVVDRALIRAEEEQLVLKNRT